MGNCLKKKSAVNSWDGEGDEWKFISPKPRISSPPAQYSVTSSSEAKSRRRENKCKKVHFNAYVEVFGGGYDDEELKVEEKKEQVRIKIGKKQLKVLLGKVELETMSADEMMSCLVAEIRSGEPHVNDHGHNPCAI